MRWPRTGPIAKRAEKSKFRESSILRLANFAVLHKSISGGSGGVLRFHLTLISSDDVSFEKVMYFSKAGLSHQPSWANSCYVDDSSCEQSLQAGGCSKEKLHMSI